jgi:hypothetical protein
MAETVNIIFITNENTIYRSGGNQLPTVQVLPAAINAAGVRAALLAAPAPAPFVNINSIDPNYFIVLPNTVVIPAAGGAAEVAIHFAIYRVNNVTKFLNNTYVANGNPVIGYAPGGAAIAPIPLANILECLLEGPPLLNIPDVVAPAPAAAESPRRTKKLYFLDSFFSYLPFPFGRYGPFRIPPLISQDSLRIPVKSAMPPMAPTVPRTGAPTAPSAPRAPGPNTAPTSTKAPRSPGAKSSPRTRNSPRKQSPNGSTRGRSPRTGSPRGRSPRARSPGRMSPGRMSPGRMSPRMSPGRMSRGRRGGFYEKYLKYKTKYLALKKELGL